MVILLDLITKKQIPLTEVVEKVVATFWGCNGMTICFHTFLISRDIYYVTSRQKFLFNWISIQSASKKHLTEMCAHRVFVMLSCICVLPVEKFFLDKNHVSSQNFMGNSPLNI